MATLAHYTAVTVLPRYSPNFNPIEQGILKAQGTPAESRQRTIQGFWSTIDGIVDLYSPQECASHFADGVGERLQDASEERIYHRRVPIRRHG